MTETDGEVLRRLADDLRTNVSSADRERLREIARHIPVRKRQMKRCVQCNTPLGDITCWYCGRVNA